MVVASENLLGTENCFLSNSQISYWYAGVPLASLGINPLSPGVTYMVHKMRISLSTPSQPPRVKP